MTATPPTAEPRRVVVLASGGGTTLQALLDAAADPAYGAGSWRSAATARAPGRSTRAEAAGVATFVLPLGDPDRAAWDAALADAVAAHRPDLVVSAGFMRLVGPAFLARFGGRFVNTHPALLPAFPGMHARARRARVRREGHRLHALRRRRRGRHRADRRPAASCRCDDGDDEAALHERIKAAERALLVDVVGRMAPRGLHGQRTGR